MMQVAHSLPFLAPGASWWAAGLHVLAMAVWVVVIPGTAGAAQAPREDASIRGTVRSALDGVPVPDVVLILVRPGTGERLATVVSGPDGRFELGPVSPGRYELRAVREGFQTKVRSGVVVRTGATTDVDLVLAIARVTEVVDVTAEGARAERAPTAGDRVAGELADVAPLSGDNFRALLPILPGVIRRPDGKISLKGGRPDQSGLQVSDANVTDPVTGDFGIELPMDAVESVEVIASPYAAEYGRFSSGVARIETRRSDNDWRFTINNFVPIPRFENGTIHGLRSFGPRVLAGGALVRDRLFVTQSAQYEILRTRVSDLPEDADDRELERFNSFTRLDANLSGAHRMTGTLAIFPRDQRFVTLDTLNPLPVTPDLRERGFQVDVGEDAAVGSRTLLASRFTLRHYDVAVTPQGGDAMVLAPEGRRGHYFARHDRESESYQLIESVSHAASGRLGHHLLKAGLDLLYSRYRGTSDHGPVVIVDEEGSPRTRLEFPGTATLSASSADLAVFAQDRWRVNDRVLLELGLRADRDGVLRRWHLSPRAGMSAAVFREGRGIVRGGIGVFYQRTPLGIATFESIESRVETRLAAGGGRPEASWTFRPRSAAARTPRAVVWSLDYRHRIGDHAAIKIGHLRRDGHDEFIVDPVRNGTASELVLRTEGQSRYDETELSFSYIGTNGLTAHASYVHSRSEGDFNAHSRLYGDLAEPVIRPNASGLGDVDVPHRFVFRGTFPIGDTRWSVVPIVEVRSGFPYSVIDVDQQFVGPPNGGGRFPALTTLDLAINRVFDIKGRRVMLGVRSHNLLNAFVPRDVQNNLASPRFGSFANGIPRAFGVTMQIIP